jgi:hypothetical protein
MGMVIVKREDMKVFCFLSLTPIVPQIDTPLRQGLELVFVIYNTTFGPKRKSIV